MGLRPHRHMHCITLNFYEHSLNKENIHMRVGCNLKLCKLVRVDKSPTELKGAAHFAFDLKLGCNVFQLHHCKNIRCCFC